MVRFHVEVAQRKQQLPLMGLGRQSGKLLGGGVTWLLKEKTPSSGQEARGKKPLMREVHEYKGRGTKILRSKGNYRCF